MSSTTDAPQESSSINNEVHDKRLERALQGRTIDEEIETWKEMFEEWFEEDDRTKMWVDRRLYSLGISLMESSRNLSGSITKDLISPEFIEKLEELHIKGEVSLGHAGERCDECEEKMFVGNAGMKKPKDALYQRSYKVYKAKAKAWMVDYLYKADCQSEYVKLFFPTPEHIPKWGKVVVELAYNRNSSALAAFKSLIRAYAHHLGFKQKNVPDVKLADHDLPPAWYKDHIWNRFGQALEKTINVMTETLRNLYGSARAPSVYNTASPSDLLDGTISEMRKIIKISHLPEFYHAKFLLEMSDRGSKEQALYWQLLNFFFNFALPGWDAAFYSVYYSPEDLEERPKNEKEAQRPPFFNQSLLRNTLRDAYIEYFSEEKCGFSYSNDPDDSSDDSSEDEEEQEQGRDKSAEKDGNAPVPGTTTAAITTQEDEQMTGV